MKNFKEYFNQNKKLQELKKYFLDVKCFFYSQEFDINRTAT